MYRANAQSAAPGGSERCALEGDFAYEGVFEDE